MVIINSLKEIIFKHQFYDNEVWLVILARSCRFEWFDDQ